MKLLCTIILICNSRAPLCEILCFALKSRTYFHNAIQCNFLLQRGIWCAAMDGELSKVTKFLSTGVNPNLTDSSGYTPLVSKKCSNQTIYKVYYSGLQQLYVCTNPSLALFLKQQLYSYTYRYNFVCPQGKAQFCYLQHLILFANCQYFNSLLLALCQS